jgi:iron complex outermembrane recepter protein
MLVLGTGIGLLNYLVMGIAPVGAEGKPIKPILRIDELNQPATTVKEWLSQAPAPIRITGVKLNPTDAGLEVILETETGTTIQPVTRTEGNILIAEISNATLALSSGPGFTANQPVAGVATVNVTQADAQTVRVSIVGTETVPTASVKFSPSTPVAEKPTTSEEEMPDEGEEEIVATGQKEGGYAVPNSSVGTRTDAKLRDVPQSIQVVPRQVIEDQAATDIEDVLRNVSGVSQQGGDSGRQINIRGLDATDNIKTGGTGGVSPAQIDFDLSNIEQVEVLKGPSSVLYGSGEPGGIINIVTKQPLKDPRYELTGTIGNFDRYRGAVDFTGPLNENKTILYRLNASYGDEGSFIDFVNSKEFAIFPVLRFQLGKNTDLTLEGSYENQSETLDGDLPVVGTILPNPLGKVPRNRFLGEPDFNKQNISKGDIGYRLNHRFSDNWSVTNQFKASFGNNNLQAVFSDGLEADNRTISRSANQGTTSQEQYTLQTDVKGKVKTGIVNHDLLVGLELSRGISKGQFRDALNTPSIDLFEPEYGNLPSDFEVRLSEKIIGNTVGIYAQDLLSIGDKVKILIGGRFDWSQENFEDRLAGTSETNEATGFSPRVGIVYQPIKPVSLFAGWSRSFTPNFGADAAGNLFKPTTGEQLEVGVKTEFLDGKLAATLAAYQINRRNDFVPDPNNPDEQIQIGEQRSRGIEFDLTGEPLPGLRLIATYAYTDAKITEDTTGREGNRLGSVPQHSGSLWAIYELQKGNLKGFGFGAGIFASSDFPGSAEDDTFTAPGYLRTDALLYYRRNNWRVQLNVENLFDTEYFETPFGGVKYGDPFTIKGTVSVTF